MLGNIAGILIAIWIVLIGVAFVMNELGKNIMGMYIGTTLLLIVIIAILIYIYKTEEKE